MPISEVYNMDCLEYMRSLPDKHFDLCIADPPYVALEENTGTIRTTGNKQASLALGGKPKDEVFQELFRVSKHQIIWGANNSVIRSKVLWYGKRRIFPMTSQCRGAKLQV
jgi:site-specific DNA-methyltransferase (adenine-specific)